MIRIIQMERVTVKMTMNFMQKTELKTKRKAFGLVTGAATDTVEDGGSGRSFDKIFQVHFRN